ncbi:HAUS augmin-like complex subunit 3 isoform X2 [Andrena cerasifolii]|uniref:HAUS augmin-like complex subunit 3 isoform X2 n=1 Tax=Andrena cerasifolii TaxID=2819439 RepID=UPI004037681F
MSISGKILHDKVRNLRPDFSSIVTPAVLDKVCEEPSVQPFLKWFCENVTHANVLSDEEVQIKNRLYETNEWLEGPELDRALEEATRNNPDILKTLSFDDADRNNLFAEYEIMKESYKEDANYIHVLQNGIQNLKMLEAQLDEDIEKEEEALDMECIKADKAYIDCSGILKEFDANNREFFNEVESLLNVYADAAENKGLPLLWTQMPLELFIRKIELYDQCLRVHIRRQFGNTDKEEQETDPNYVFLLNDGKASRIDNEKLQKLMLCKTNLINAKMEVILARIQEKSNVAMLECAEDIFNLGNLKVPRQSELKREISLLTRKRDFLEENVCLLQERQLTDAVQQFAELEITKVLKQDACRKLEERRARFEKLKNLRFLAREHGHVRVDLLSILMQMQFRRLKDVSEFVADARHYLTSEYLLSSARYESMQQQQNEYSAIVSSSSKAHNSFNKFLISMISSNGNVCQLNSELDKYNELIDQNRNKKKLLLETYINSKIYHLQTSESEVNQQYTNELRREPTYNFKLVPYKIETCYNETFDSLQKIQADIMKIRNQMKERMKTNMGFEREKDILWQRFLAEPDTLKRMYKEVNQLKKQSCYRDTSQME